MIKEFDRKTLHLIRPEIEKALSELGAKYGIKLALGRCRFESKNATFNLDLSTLSESGEAETKEANAFKRYAQFCGLDASDLGKEFYCNGSIYKITGYNVNAKKMPILGTRSDGKRFKFPVHTVKAGLVPNAEYNALLKGKK
jgi:hypothetical protein